MRFHDGTADRQPHTAALRFRGKEGFEDFVRHFPRDSPSLQAKEIGQFSTAFPIPFPAQKIRIRIPILHS
jgi:hypothetical protein